MTRGRTAFVALLVAAAALLGSACSSTTPNALDVDGQTVSRSDLLAELDTLAADPRMLSQLFGTPSAAGEAPGTYSTTLTAQVLQLHVLDAVLTQVVADEGLTVAEADRQQALQNVASRLGVAGDLGGLGPVVANIIASQQVLTQSIQARLATEDALRALFEEQGGSNAEVACSSHILVRAGTGQAQPTEADYAAARTEIDAAAARLAGGADFATVAREVSDDASAAQGGSLGCEPKGAFITAFDDVVWSQPLGVPSAPVRTQFGWHIVKVDERRPVRFEDVRDQLATQLGQQTQAVIDELVGAGLSRASVTVDERFGRWDQTALAVAPPEGPAPAPGTGAAADLAGTGTP